MRKSDWRVQLGYPTGHYVYAWFVKNELIYIGCGCYERGVAVHKAKGHLTPGEKLRQEAGEAFRCEVLKDKLPKQLAYQVEQDLIWLMQPKANRSWGQKLLKWVLS